MGTVRISIGKGNFATIDEIDFPLVSQHKWQAIKSNSGKLYAYSSTIRTLMHRYIMNAPAGIEVDHRNGDSLDNTRRNMRLATASQNHANSKPRQGCSSEFKGVCFRKSRGTYQSVIMKDGVYKSLGYYNNEEDAARAYDIAATDMFGEFARINFPGRLNDPPPVRRMKRV